MTIDRHDPADARQDGRARSDKSRTRDRVAGSDTGRQRAVPIPSLDALGDTRVPVAFGRDVYQLRTRDVALLRVVGTFRAIYAHDLRHRHTGLDRDTRTLREQGLLASTRVQRPDTRATVEVLSLTRSGRDLVQAAEPGEQRYHSDVVRLREVHHDAQLWRMYGQHLAVLHERGAQVVAVRLDHELKQALWTHDPHDAAHDPADALGLPRDATGRVHIPDLQVVTRERDGGTARCNLELTTPHYSAASIRAKVDAGFVLYSPIEDRDFAASLLDF